MRNRVVRRCSCSEIPTEHLYDDADEIDWKEPHCVSVHDQYMLHGSCP